MKQLGNLISDLSDNKILNMEKKEGRKNLFAHLTERTHVSPLSSSKLYWKLMRNIYVLRKSVRKYFSYTTNDTIVTIEM